jgi:DNA-binding transcriptional MerR regulator
MTKNKVQPKPLRSGELAKLTGVSTDTLRHYERKGVISRPARLSNGYRVYPASSVERVRLIRRALSVGFTLTELASFIKAREQGNPPCHEVRALAQKKLADVGARIFELNALRAELEATLEDWDELLKKGPTGRGARLLESLAEQEPSLDKPSRRISAAPFNTRGRKVNR